MTDARIVRTRASLHRSILCLASRKPVTEITVSELADAADINRVTFYKHYSSPADALHAALSQELDPAREALCPLRARASCNPRRDFIATVAMVLDHIEHHRDVYERSFSTAGDGIAANVLSNHFTDTVRMYLDLRLSIQPTPPELDADLVASLMGMGFVGPVSLWILEKKHDRVDLLNALLVFTPTWWFPDSTTEPISDQALAELVSA